MTPIYLRDTEPRPRKVSGSVSSISKGRAGSGAALQNTLSAVFLTPPTSAAGGSGKLGLVKRHPNKSFV